MGILEFILGILVIIVIFLMGVGAVCMKWNTQKLEDEIIVLKKEISRLRKRKNKERQVKK